MSKWKRVSNELPPEGVVVKTKIHDVQGTRNEQSLKLGPNGLWFVPDGKMYVYYEPTHWSEEQAT